MNFDKATPTPRRALTAQRVLDTLQDRVFLLPIGGGLVLIALSMLHSSPFKWIVIFAFIVGVPCWLAYCVRRPHLFLDDETIKPLLQLETSIETGSLKQLGHVFSSCMTNPNLDETQVREVLRVYNELKAVVAYFGQEVRAFDGELEEIQVFALVGTKTLRMLFHHLKSCARELADLSGIDTGRLLRKMQNLSGKNQMSDQDRDELLAMQNQSQKRMVILARILESIDQADRLRREFLGLLAEFKDETKGGDLTVFVQKMGMLQTDAENKSKPA